MARRPKLIVDGKGAFKDLTKFLHEENYHIHRGTFDGRDFPPIQLLTESVQFGVVIFGNDSYGDDPRSEKEVELLRDALTKLGLKAGHFSHYKGTWALEVVGDTDEDSMNKLVWDAWFQACGSPELSPYQATNN